MDNIIVEHIAERLTEIQHELRSLAESLVPEDGRMTAVEWEGALVSGPFARGALIENPNHVVCCRSITNPRSAACSGVLEAASCCWLQHLVLP